MMVGETRSGVWTHALTRSGKALCGVEIARRVPEGTVTCLRCSRLAERRVRRGRRRR